MKQYIALIIGLMVFLGCIFGGCGKPHVENVTDPAEGTANKPAEEPADEPEDENILSVYLVQNDVLYADAIGSFQEQAPDTPLKVTTFRTYQAMFDVLKEELPANGGPDVVLYNSMEGEVDGYRLATSGEFLPLDSFVEQLDPVVYPATLMNAGNIAGKQYFIPFSYNLIYAYTSQQRMAEMGYTPSDNLYGMMVGESERFMDAPDRVTSARYIYRPDPVNSFFDAAGIRFFDKTSGEVTVDKEALAEACRFVKVFYDEAEKVAALYREYNQFTRNFEGAAQCFSFFTEDVSFLDTVRYYQSMFSKKVNSPMIALPYHKSNNPRELCASIVCFGGVNANTRMPEKAYELLKYILDYDVSNSWAENEAVSAYYAPVNLVLFQKAVDKLACTTGHGPVTIAPLAEENEEQLRENAQKITDAAIPNATLGFSLQDVLDPYFTGEGSFEDCYNGVLTELQQYLSE